MEGHQNREDWNIRMMLDYVKNYNIENIEPIQELFKRIFNFLAEITEKYKDRVKSIQNTDANLSLIIKEK